MQMKLLANYFQRLENTTSRNEMVAILAEMFKQADPSSIDRIIYLCQGRLAPHFVPLEFGVSEKLTMKALAEMDGVGEEKVKELYRTTGDLGMVAEQLASGPPDALTVQEVFDLLYRIATASGPGSVGEKVSLLQQLLRRASGIEARYAVRIVLGRLRLGIGDPTILDALSYAYVGDKSLRPRLERAYNLCSDLGLVAKTLFNEGLQAIEAFKPSVGHPIRPALAERLPSPEAILAKIGRCSVEPKYDGFRCQIHKDGLQVKIFSRNLEDTTSMFPDIANATLRQIRDTRAIFEGEAIGYDPDTGEFVPFQVTVQRKRKYGIEEMQEKLPLLLFAFDMMYCDEGDYTPRPLLERRTRLASMIASQGEGDRILMSEGIVTDSVDELTRFFEDCISRGLEGIVAKRLESPYHAGARNFNWIKLKRSYQLELSDTVDVVLVGYLHGRGSRARFGIGSLLAAVYDDEEDKFKTIAKIGSGLSEEQWVEMKRLLDEIAVPHRPARVDALIEPDVWVEPRYVVEVQADEITRSPVHTAGRPAEGGSGYALRFPRVVGFIRTDKGPEEATTVKEILEMYAMQGKKALPE
jgi:DNA ligase-1